MSLRLCVAGDGAWGKALAHVARTAGNDVTVWSRRNPDRLSLQDADAVILAVPAQAVRDALLALHLDAGASVIIAAKGIERGSTLLMADVVREIVADARPLVLSGPSFARDVMAGLPTAVTLAADDLQTAATWAKVLSLPTFRIYQSDDLLGVELGGSLKNVLAIACGISDGRGFGQSARAALITRGFAELVRLSRKLGAKSETLMGLSGLGDLLLTCGSPQSRNYGFGLAIGQGESVAEALVHAMGVVEGATTAVVAAALARRHGIDMPIIDAVHAIVDGGADPSAVINALLARPALSEFSKE